jgi:hypothetical protein
MERFFEMAMILFLMTLIINVGFQATSNNLSLPPLSITNQNFDLNQAMQTIGTQTIQGNYDVNSSGITILTSLPSQIITGIIAGVLSIIYLSQMILTTPLLWTNFFNSIGVIIDPQNTGIHLILIGFGTLLAGISYIGLTYIALRLASLIRGVAMI